MNCADCKPLLDAHIDGELDLVNMLAIERHLSSCSDCEKQVRQAKTVRLALQNPALSYSAPATFRSKVLDATRATDKPHLERRNRRWFNIPSFAFGAVCATAAAFAFSVVTFPGNQNIANELVDAHVRSLMADHLTDVQSTDSHTVKPWFTGKVDFTAPVKDLTSEGFPLIGGRLDYIQNHPAIALVYKRNQHTINVFVRPTNERGERAAKTTSQRGFSIAHQKIDGLQLEAVSDLNPNDLADLLFLITR
jgi:anti-sigma factor RsiW